MGQSFSYPNMTTRKDIRIYVHGFYGAGKKSILEKLNVNPKKRVGGPGQEIQRATKKNITLLSWDLGGRCYSRAMARHLYSQGVDILLFVVDSADDYYLPYFGQGQEMLSTLLKEEDLQDTIVLVLANKQDLPGARSVEEVAKELGFLDATRSHVAAIMGCSAETGEGIQEAMDWMAKTFEAKTSKKLEFEKKEKDEKASRSLASYMKEGFQTLKSMVQKSG